MPANITPVDTFTAPVVVATDADAANGTEKLLTAQALVNRSEFLFNRVPQGSVQTAYPVNMSAIAFQFSDNVVSWELSSPSGWLQKNLTSNRIVTVDITHLLPAGGTLDSVRARLDGIVSHGAGFPGALDAQLPFIQVVSVVRTTGGASTFGKIVDPSTSNAAYEQTHVIESPGLAETVDPLKSYYIEFRGELGTGWGEINSCLLFALEIGWTP